ncbi:hypothetical protein VNO78_34307 [Psophocarpus tetragonolobus]|uniref:Uncharacterized protein n=1 Tax=Psophocarpus tetragonolobus TaxID=3891 RepID=A0AAN9RPY2_PSOTE
MAAKEFHPDQAAGNEESTLLQVDPYEEEETLSLCDLPIYSGSVSGRWGGDDWSKEDGKSFGDDDNLFEFFSEEFSTSSNATAENIIFCGKLIPFKDIPPRVESSNDQKGSVILPWKPVKKAKPTLKKEEKLERKGCKSFSCDYTSNGKVSLLRCTTKSRWFLFMFGMSKLPSTEMELRDIRNRQSRRRGAAVMFPTAAEGKSGCRGMWKMLKSISLVLGCRSSKIAKDVVKAAFVKVLSSFLFFRNLSCVLCISASVGHQVAARSPSHCQTL